MENSKKAYLIIGCCILLVAAFSAVILYRAFLFEKKTYEQIDMEQAAEYMEYEEDYLIIDVRPETDYLDGHLPGAVNLPLEQLEEKAILLLKDKEQMIYVYGGSGKESRKAARWLGNRDYINITEIGDFRNWKGTVEK